MRVVMLGPVRAYDETGEPIEIGGRRVRMLLARLALEPGRVLSTETLIDGLWGADIPGDAVKALQALVSRLRKALDGATALESVAGGYRLALGEDDVDALRFEAMIADGRRDLAAGHTAEASERLEAALTLWEGAPLADVRDAPYAGPVATRLEELHISATEESFEAELALGRHTEVLAGLEAAASEHPLRERLAGLRMRALTLAGRRSEALRAYAKIRTTLADELGIDPGAELQQTHLEILRSDAMSPEPAPTRPTGHMPAPLTSFVGRAPELRRLDELMRDHRLVTIAGPGGAGKTRLAVEAVSRHPAHRDDRAWFVPLAGVSAPDGVANAVLTRLGPMGIRGGPSGALGAGATAPADPIDRTVDLLGDREAMLVLDNCEHLLDAVADLAHRLLERLPSLRILATSREALAITGEALVTLRPLDVAGDAVQLFVDRATAVRPGFALDEQTREPVVEICRRLDGLPLALELAAARLRSMHVEQIARRLDDRFRLLTSGSRTADPRQRTLLAVVEWSWDLLTEQEQALAGRLSLFPGGATAEAIEAVCADEGLPKDDIVYVLGSLVEKSLVDASGRSLPRYRMLQTVRAYAAERLTGSGERQAIAQRLVDHYVELAERRAPALLSSEQLETLAVFDAERENLDTALRTAIDAGDAESSYRLLGPLYGYWNLRAFDARAEALVGEVLGFGDALPEDVRAALAAILLLAGNSRPGPDPEQVRAAIEECSRTNAMDRFPLLIVIVPAAYLFGYEELAERELARARTSADPVQRIGASWVQAFIRDDRGDWAGAARARAETRRMAEKEVGDLRAMAMVLNGTARDHALRGDHDAAIADYRRSVDLAAELGSEDEIWYRSRLAAELVRAGDAETARRVAELSLERAAERGQRLPWVEALVGLADVHRRTGEPGEADRLLDRAEDLVRELGVPGAGGRLPSVRMATALASGAVGRARELLPEAVAAVFAVRDIAPAVEFLARLLFLEGDAAGAATALGMSTAVRGTSDEGEPELRELRTALVERLGESAYENAYAEGAELPRDEALRRLRPG